MIQSPDSCSYNTTHATLQSSTCRFFSAAIDQLHLTIEIIIGPSTPYPLFLLWFLLSLSSVVCYHPTPGEKFDFFMLRSSRSLHRLHSLQSNFSADSQPASLYYSCSLLFFRAPFAFRQSGMCYSSAWCRATLWYQFILDFGFWILAQEGDGYLDPIKCPPMRLYAQDGCVLKNS